LEEVVPVPASASLEASSPPSPAAGPPPPPPAAPRKKLRPLPSSTGKNAILLPAGEEGGATILFRARNETKSLCLSMLLSEPSADEECPITMEPIARSYLHFLPGAPLFEEHPLLLKATLQACNHSFSATALLFHFACSGMACPCCRQGDAKEFLHVAGCLPERIARPVQEYVQAMRRKEGEEAHRENTEAALAILRESEGEFSLSRFLRTHRVAMFIYAFEDDSSVRPLNVSELPMNLQEREHDVTLTAPRHSIRAWTGNLNAVPVTLRLLHLSLGTRDLMDHILLLDNLPGLRLPDFEQDDAARPYVHHVQGPERTGTFELEFEQGQELPEIRNITWRVPRPVFAQMLLMPRAG
jgi:hypothetical protein